jgi:hypothetical protein
VRSRRSAAQHASCGWPPSSVRPSIGKPDRIGVPCRVRQSAWAVNADKDWHSLLEGAQDADAVEAIVLAVEGDFLAVQEPAEELHGFHQTSLAHARWIEALAGGGVLRKGVASADADLEATVAKVVDAGELPRQVDGIVEVVVQHQGADLQARGAVGHRDQWRQRSPAIEDVVPRVDHVEAGVFDGPRKGAQTIGRDIPDLEAKAERAHSATVACGCARHTPRQPSRCGPRRALDVAFQCRRSVDCV